MTTATVHIVMKNAEAAEQKITFYRKYNMPLPCWVRMEEQARHTDKGTVILAVDQEKPHRTFEYSPGRWLSFQDWWHDAL